ncbi:MAG: SCO family protein [Pseudomonadota bacterium]|jgi:protein SCO1/2|nr:SCO family protein [Pseudomonadota bacterium]
MKKTWAGWGLFVLLLGLLLSLPLLGYLTKDGDYYGFKTDLPVPPLPGCEGGSERLRLVFFGYQGCGTVCPLQLGNLLELHRRLRGESVGFIFVTLDPERDSQRSLDATMRGLGAQFCAVRPASRVEAQRLAMGFSEYAGKIGSKEQYEFSHSARIHVVTADNRRQLLYPSPELDLDRVQADIHTLLSQSREARP